MAKHPPFTYLKNNIYYFNRVVPKDLVSHYHRRKLVCCLHVRTAKQAEIAARHLNAKLEQQWMQLRIGKDSLPFTPIQSTIDNDEEKNPEVTLLTAKDYYLKIKGHDRSKSFFQTVERSLRYAEECLTDKPINQYTSQDAANLRNFLIEKGLGLGSVKKTISTIKTIFNFYTSEHGITSSNPFTGIYIPTAIIEKRQPILGADLIKLQKICIGMNDEIRLLIAILSDTGMRLAEAAGLLTTDIYLESDIPHIKVIPHPHRPLKTQSSEREIPLVGTALIAARNLCEQCTAGYLFPTYNQNQQTNSNSASSVTNRWMKKNVSDRYVIHGLRHGMRDRLRAVNTPPEIIDQIGGWSKGTVGSNYGNGYQLKQLHSWMSKLNSYPQQTG